MLIRKRLLAKSPCHIYNMWLVLLIFAEQKAIVYAYKNALWNCALMWWEHVIGRSNLFPQRMHPNLTVKGDKIRKNKIFLNLLKQSWAIAVGTMTSPRVQLIAFMCRFVPDMMPRLWFISNIIRALITILISRWCLKEYWDIWLYIISC